MRASLLRGIGTVAAASVVAVLLGCGSARRSAAPPPAQIRAAFAGSPMVLAALHRQGSQLLGGGASGLQRELAALRGFPVVINKWASWCDPCREEFPFFQQASVRFGRRVAFLGIDGPDNAGDARHFLALFPVTYPSFEDPSEQIARSLHAPRFYPETLFLDRAGHVFYVHQGAYPSQAKLLADVRRYALGA